MAYGPRFRLQGFRVRGQSPNSIYEMPQCLGLSLRFWVLLWSGV